MTTLEPSMSAQVWHRRLLVAVMIDKCFCRLGCFSSLPKNHATADVQFRTIRATQSNLEGHHSYPGKIGCHKSAAPIGVGVPKALREPIGALAWVVLVAFLARSITDCQLPSRWQVQKPCSHCRGLGSGAKLKTCREAHVDLVLDPKRPYKSKFVICTYFAVGYS